MTPQPPPPPDVDPAAIEQTSQQFAKQPGTLKDILRGEDFRKALAELKLVTPSRFVRIALTTMMRIPELGECSRPSLFRCLLELSSYGLEPDGRRAHLIPFKNKKLCQCGHLMDEHRGQQCSRCGCGERRTLVECTLILDYKGLAELVRRSGDVSYIHADVVYEGDEWDYSFGSGAFLKHKPGENRGTKRKAFYSFVKLKDGSEDFRVLQPKDIEAIRKRSKSPDQGPWVTDYDAMGIKTAFRQHSKWLPLSTYVRDAVEREDPDAIDGSTWTEVLGREETPPPRMAAAKDKILSQPSFAPEGDAPAAQEG